MTLTTTTESEVETERVTQVWPKAVKNAVRDKVGKREMTAYTVAAVERHLHDSDRLDALVLELNETKALVQLLADRLAMGAPEAADRLAALMEVDWPAWVETVGWEPAAAGIVKKPALSTAVEEPVETPVQTPVVQTAPESLGGTEGSDTYDDIEASREAGAGTTTPDPTVGDTPTGSPATASPESPAVESSASAGTEPRDDLFARVMERTGGELDPGFAGLKTASELAPPATPAPVDGPIGGAPETPDVMEPEVEPVVEPGRLDLPPEQRYPVLGEPAAPISGVPEVDDSIDDGSPMESTGVVYDTPEEMLDALDARVAEVPVERCPVGHELVAGECWECA